LRIDIVASLALYRCKLGHYKAGIDREMPPDGARRSVVALWYGNDEAGIASPFAADIRSAER
jgi:hypothetical protein